MSYDGKGRRIKKAIANDADFDCTYLYYHDGDSVVETRNGSGYVLKQQVWGTQYVDELVQVGINQDPDNANPSLPDNQEENLCERFFWACQDANYNVLGVVYSTGVLSERYEYSPYGKRTVFSRGWLLADLDDDGSVGIGDSAIFNAAYGTTNPPHRADLDGDGDIDIGDSAIFNAAYGSAIATADPYAESPRAGGGSFRGRIDAGNATPLCEHGHQGLAHDEEINLVYNRARMLVPAYGRFGGRDPIGYFDTDNLFESSRSNPGNYVDPSGWCALPCRCLCIEHDVVPDENSPSISGPRWGAYRDGSGFRVGFKLRTTFYIEGDKRGCKFNQNERGSISGENIDGSVRPGAPVHGGDRPINPNWLNGPSTFGGYTFTDRLGMLFPDGQNGTMRVTLNVDITWVCESSDGTLLITPTYTVAGSVNATRPNPGPTRPTLDSPGNVGSTPPLARTCAQ